MFTQNPEFLESNEHRSYPLRSTPAGWPTGALLDFTIAVPAFITKVSLYNLRLRSRTLSFEVVGTVAGEVVTIATAVADAADSHRPVPLQPVESLLLDGVSYKLSQLVHGLFVPGPDVGRYEASSSEVCPLLLAVVTGNGVPPIQRLNGYSGKVTIRPDRPVTLAATHAGEVQVLDHDLLNRVKDQACSYALSPVTSINGVPLNDATVVFF